MRIRNDKSRIRERDRDEWKQQAESLQDELDSLNEYVTELENQNFDLSNNISGNIIKDFEAFKNRLFSDGIMTYELEVWLDEYMRWYNK